MANQTLTSTENSASNRSYSVVIPSLVEDPYLPAALESVMAQTLPPTRVLVMINGDSAGIDNFRSQLNGRFPGIEVFLTRAPGMISAIVEGIQRAKTCFVSFLDADDLWLPGKQERQISRLVNEPALHGVYGKVRNFHQDSFLDEKAGTEAVDGRMFTATTFRTECFQKFGPPDVTATHHTWLYRWWHEATRKNIRVESIGEEVLLRRIHEKNSWKVAAQLVHTELLAELRSFTRGRRGDDL